MRNIYRILLATIFSLFAIPYLVFAHGLGTSKDQTVGNYLVEFEYDTLGDIEAGQLSGFTFELLDAKTKEGAPYDRVFIRFKNEGGTVLSGNLVPVESFGRKSSRINTTFNSPGTNNAELSFYKDDKQIAQANFDFTVVSKPTQAPPKEFPTKFIYMGIITFETILLVILGLNRKRLTYSGSTKKVED